MPIALAEQAYKESVDNLNQLLADTMRLRDLHEKHHWQITGPTFYQLHLLFDKHYDEQTALVDANAERIQVLGGVSVAMAPDVAETTLIPRPPKGREEAPVQISRLLHAHEIVLKEARAMARRAADTGDDGTLLEEALRLAPEWDEVQLSAAIALYFQGRHDVARGAFREIFARKPGLAAWLTRMADAHG